MLAHSACGVSTCAWADTFGSGDNEFTIEFVEIGNPGNPPDDRAKVKPNPVGSVPYVYRIAKYEISREMISKANAEGNLGISMHSFRSHLNIPTAPRDAMPATGVVWTETARFVNWLNTSRGFTPAYKFPLHPPDAPPLETEDPLLWNANEAGYDPANPLRNRLAKYFLPSVHEWYKAAYYDPRANQGAGGYWNFATGSNSAPTPVPSGTQPGTAVYDQDGKLGPADITQAGGLSAYGVMALTGNVWEWEETEYDLVNDQPWSVRGIRGGSWYAPIHFVGPTFRAHSGRIVPDMEFGNIGFRVASVAAEAISTAPNRETTIAAEQPPSDASTGQHTQLRREAVRFRFETPDSQFGAPLDLPRMEWTVVQEPPAHATLIASSPQGDAATITVDQLAHGRHEDIRLIRPTIALRAGQRFDLAFQARASKPRKLLVQLVDSADRQRIEGVSRERTVGAEWSRFVEQFTCPVNVESPALVFAVGQTFGEVELSQVEVIPGELESR